MEEKNAAPAWFQTEKVVIGDGSSRLSTAVFVLICFIPVFSTLLFGAVDNTTWVILSVVIAAIMLLWLTDAWRGRGLLVNPSGSQLPLVGLVLIGLIQLLPLAGGQAPLPDVSRALSLDPYSTRLFVGRLVLYLVFFAACLAFVNNRRRLGAVVLMIILFGSGMAFFGILQRLAGPDGIYGLRETPQAIPFGPFVNQHHFAAFMQMTGGVALGLLFGTETARDRKILLATAMMVMGVAVVLTGSRGGILGFASVFAFVTLITVLSGRRASKTVSQRKLAAAAAFGAALLLVIAGVAIFVGGNDSLLRGIGLDNPDADISSGRFHFWSIAVRIFFEHPFLGAGLDAFGVAFTKHDSWSGLFRVEQAHNDYLQTLADAGIAGFACIAVFIFLLFKNGLRVVAESSGFRHDAAVGALAGCFGILIHSFFDFPLRTPSNAFFFLMLCAVATVTIATRRRVSTSP